MTGKGSTVDDSGMRLKPGSLVVLEGLDRSGKSTQRNRLSALGWAEPVPVFTHMPSGLTSLTKSIYRLTEEAEIHSPLARQLLHLTCHAENMPAITDARQRRAVVLDRWWWSTVAYGWYGGRLLDVGVSEEVFRGMIGVVWSNQPADVVFLFSTPYEHDELNRDEVLRGYNDLAAEHTRITVTVPPGDEDATTAFIVDQLRARDLLSG
ncbi:MAG: dTMP kinase [Pseudonocardiaceae bacterium]